MSKNERVPIDSVAALEAAIARIREAQRVFSTYTQEQVDRIFAAAASAANKARLPLAKQAVAETGMGVVEDKVIKNNYAAEYIYNAYKDTRTCGVIERDPAFGITRIAEPLGVVAAVIPTTNPTSTAIFKCLIALKTRNAIIISPHPRAKNCTAEAARIIREAAEAAGAPKGVIDWIDAPSLDMTNLLMKEADIILATGGPGMVKAAYSSGKPAIGVGAGNTPAVIDESADVILAVNSIIHSKTFDNGMICASEQSVIVHKKVYAAVKDEFARRGCYFLKGGELEKVRKTIIINGALNAKIVGQSAFTIASLAGVKVPEGTKILIGEVESVELSEEFAHEKLSPVLAMYKAENLEDAFAKAERLIADGGYGHTSSIYLDETACRDRLDAFAARMKTCRVLVNTPSSHGGIGDLYNFKLAPSLTLGCGSWGGNSVSENVGVKHLLNIKTVAERRENMLWFRAPEKVYIKKGCTPVALDELKNTLGRKRAFIVTDAFLYEHGFTKPVTDKLDELGLAHATFFNVAPDPTLASAKEGAAQMSAFKPDCIIAIVAAFLLEIQAFVALVAGAGGINRQAVLHQESVDVAAGCTAVSAFVDVGTLAGSDVLLTVVFSPQEHFAHGTGIGLAEHLEVGVPAVRGGGLGGVHHAGVVHQGVGVGHLFRGGEALIQEEVHFRFDIEALSAVVAHFGTGPVGIAGNASAALVVLLERGLIQGYAGFDQQGQVFGDAALVGKVQQRSGLVQIRQDEAGHLVARCALAGLDEHFPVVRENFFDDGEVAECAQGAEVGLGTHHIHFTHIMLHVLAREGAVFHLGKHLLEEVVAHADVVEQGRGGLSGGNQPAGVGGGEILERRSVSGSVPHQIVRKGIFPDYAHAVVAGVGGKESGIVVYGISCQFIGRFEVFLGRDVGNGLPVQEFVARSQQQCSGNRQKGINLFHRIRLT